MPSQFTILYKLCVAGSSTRSSPWRAVVAFLYQTESDMPRSVVAIATWPAGQCCTTALAYRPWKRSLLHGWLPFKAAQEWLVLKREVLTDVPQVLELVSSAGNSHQNVAKAEDELQMISKILKSIQGWGGRHNRSPLWSDIASQVLRSRPKCASSGPGIFEFCFKFGSSSKLLSETESFVRSHATGSCRELGCEIWSLMGTEIRGCRNHLYWRHMLLKFFYTSEKPPTVTDATCQNCASQNCTCTGCLYTRLG